MTLIELLIILISIGLAVLGGKIGNAHFGIIGLIVGAILGFFTLMIFYKIGSILGDLYNYLFYKNAPRWPPCECGSTDFRADFTADHKVIETCAECEQQYTYGWRKGRRVVNRYTDGDEVQIRKFAMFKGWVNVEEKQIKVSE